MRLMNIVRDQHQWREQCLRRLRTSLQWREYIKLHTRQHGESCISNKSQFIHAGAEELDLP
jgi:hypothetical protein